MMKRHFFTLFLFSLQVAFAHEGPVIALGSTNPVKYEALQNVIDDLSEKDADFGNVIIEACSVPSNVSDQPKNLEETIRGAMHRAKNAYFLLKQSNSPCDLSVGIESGIMRLKARDGYSCFDITACSIFDGKRHRLGFSCSFQLPSCVTELIFDTSIAADLGNAMRMSGLTQKFEVGKEEGSIGVLSKGKVSRRDYTEQAIRMAFIPFQNREAYGIGRLENLAAARRQ